MIDRLSVVEVWMNVYVMLGLHTSFHHSWRGDRPDETGFGTDIRVVRQILRILDDAEVSGLQARVYWDFDIHWMVEQILLCPLTRLAPLCLPCRWSSAMACCGCGPGQTSHPWPCVHDAGGLGLVAGAPGGIERGGGVASATGRLSGGWEAGDVGRRTGDQGRRCWVHGDRKAWRRGKTDQRTV